MIIVVLVVLGLCFGSFVNALVWRLHEQAKSKKKRTNEDLSILHGRSMCPECRHELAARDLLPVFSWLWLRGKCRYCRKSISWQYPLVEAATAGLFVLSYLCWPTSLLFNTMITVPRSTLFHGAVWYADVYFGLWLMLLVGFMALTVYDLRWMLLPNRIVYPLSVVAIVEAAITVAAAPSLVAALVNLVLSVAIAGGLFYLLFQLSKGKWIGGGDVRLGWLLGLLVATPARAFLVLFVAALSGSAVSLPLLASKRMKRTAVVPFGPFLILAAIIAQLYGTPILHWYQHTFIDY